MSFDKKNAPKQTVVRDLTAFLESTPTIRILSIKNVESVDAQGNPTWDWHVVFRDLTIAEEFAKAVAEPGST